MSDSPRIFFVDDEAKAGELFLRFCADSPYRCEVFRDPLRAVERFEADGADLVITDLRMPGLDGIEVLGRVRARDADVPVIITTAYASVDNAIEALRQGATDFIKKPYDMEELLALVDKTFAHEQLRAENRLLRRQLQDERLRYGMIGQSSAMHEVFRIIDKIADVRCAVIIAGESGTGKELAARAIHKLSQDAERPFVVVDCGALSDTLLESELFGHEKGAFTGATHTKPGLLETAGGGTVFLDEIGNISFAMQAKILRAVEEKQTTRVGGLRPIDINVRFLAATNRDLAQMARDGEFRHDLYQRLNVVTITMPPLRERREDVPALIQHFVERFATTYGREVQGFDSPSMLELVEYGWPGNVRELRNLVERHIALAEAPVLAVEGLGDAPATTRVTDTEPLDADTPNLGELERRYILKVLDQCEGNRQNAARILGIDKSTLWRKLQQYRTG